jgi:hypothetical protein
MVATVLKWITDILICALHGVAIQGRSWGFVGGGATIGVVPMRRGISLLRSRVNLLHWIRRPLWRVLIVDGSKASGRKVWGDDGTSGKARVNGTVGKGRSWNHFQQSKKHGMERKPGDIKFARRRNGMLRRGRERRMVVGDLQNNSSST